MGPDHRLDPWWCLGLSAWRSFLGLNRREMGQQKRRSGFPGLPGGWAQPRGTARCQLAGGASLVLARAGLCLVSSAGGGRGAWPGDVGRLRRRNEVYFPLNW